MTYNMRTAKLIPIKAFLFSQCWNISLFLEMVEEEDNSTFFQTITQLPKANRDTLAFLMLHLHKYALCWSG